ncbi:MAG: hypothetical protein R6V20_09760 [Desulfobia sp.]
MADFIAVEITVYETAFYLEYGKVSSAGCCIMAIEMLPVDRLRNNASPAPGLAPEFFKSRAEFLFFSAIQKIPPPLSGAGFETFRDCFGIKHGGGGVHHIRVSPCCIQFIPVSPTTHTNRTFSLKLVFYCCILFHLIVPFFGSTVDDSLW